MSIRKSKIDGKTRIKTSPSAIVVVNNDDCVVYSYFVSWLLMLVLMALRFEFCSLEAAPFR